jgi:hypothetical protein
VDECPLCSIFPRPEGSFSLWSRDWRAMREATRFGFDINLEQITRMSNNWAVITGLVREPGLLRDKVESLVCWRKEEILSGIVYVTWIGEIDRYDGLRDFLNAREVKVIEVREPEFDIPCTYLRQMKTLYYALGACPPGCSVLKLRTDKCELLPFIRNLLEGDIDMTPGQAPGWPEIFERRIWVQEGLLRHPFLLNDMLYFGKREDLFKLVDFTVHSEILGHRMHTEQIVFSRPFLAKFPIFNHYFYMNPGVLLTPDLAVAVDEIFFDDPFFLEVFVTYLLVLQQYFIVGTGRRNSGRRGVVSEELKGLTCRELLDPWCRGARPELQRHRDDPTVLFTGDAWIEPLLGGRLRADQLGARVVRLAAELSDYGRQTRYSGHPLSFPENARVLLQKLRGVYDNLPFPMSDLTPAASGSRVIDGPMAKVEIRSEL